MADGVRAVTSLCRLFSDPLRVRMLHLLHERGELHVTELVKILRVPQPTVSRHLGRLRRARIVTFRRDSVWSCYGLAPPRDCFHEVLIKCLGGCFSHLPQLARDVRQLDGIRQKPLAGTRARAGTVSPPINAARPRRPGPRSPRRTQR